MQINLVQWMKLVNYSHLFPWLSKTTSYWMGVGWTGILVPLSRVLNPIDAEIKDNLLSLHSYQKEYQWATEKQVYSFIGYHQTAQNIMIGYQPFKKVWTTFDFTMQLYITPPPPNFNPPAPNPCVTYIMITPLRLVILHRILYRLPYIP